MLGACTSNYLTKRFNIFYFQCLFVGTKLSTTSTTVKISDINVSNGPSIPVTKVEYLQKFLHLSPQSPSNSKLLKVAVVGCPNAGKSTLVNALTKWNVCAVAGKAHTTRSKQISALVEDETQVVFVDLPGLVNKSKLFKFNMYTKCYKAVNNIELIIVLIVVDVSHKYSRNELDYEVVKLLHFFNNKPSVLVLNKIDKLGKKQGRLLDITRKLTGGLVHGIQSSHDKYSARFERRAKMSSRTHQLIPPNEIISAHLPPVCHNVANEFLEHLVNLQRQLASSQPDLFFSQSFQTNDEIPIKEIESIEPKELSDSDTDVLDYNEGNSLLKDREINFMEKENINKYFNNYHTKIDVYVTAKSEPSLVDSQESTDEETDNGLQELAQAQKEIDSISGSGLDAMLLELKSQLLMKSATPDQVAERRKRWLDISRQVRGITQWKHFSEVFMVSSSDVKSINQLRNYLIAQALPNRSWILPGNMITDQEPTELVRMCVWAQCLNILYKEVPYHLKIVVDDCEKVKEEDGDDRIYVHARLLCQNEHHLKSVLGPAGKTIRQIAAASKLELMTMFRNETIVKLSAELIRIPKNVKTKLRAAKSFSDVFPNLEDGKT